MTPISPFDRRENPGAAFAEMQARAVRPVSFKEFDKCLGFRPVGIGCFQPEAVPAKEAILRMLVAYRGEPPVGVPDYLMPLYQAAYQHLKELGLVYPFAYLTVRKGILVNQDVSDWHTDGYSERVTHLPEQNFIWCSASPTEFYTGSVSVAPGFDPMRHNLHKSAALLNQRSPRSVMTLKPGLVYRFDPYCFHRMPKGVDADPNRLLVRLTFTNIEIDDAANTPNPGLPRSVSGKGREFRESLGVFRFEDLTPLEQARYTQGRRLGFTTQAGERQPHKKDGLIKALLSLGD